MELYILSVLVSNHFGTLTRVTNLFSRRGYNIKELTVGETDNPDYSRITIVTEGDEPKLQQIQSQLSKLHDVKVAQILPFDQSVSRELLLIKLRESRQLFEKLENMPHRILDRSEGCIIVEITGETGEINSFIKQMQGCEIMEMCRTGLTALKKGVDIIKIMEDVNNGNDVL